MNCKQCQKDISEKVANYSLKMYGVELCMDCQKGGKKKAPAENSTKSVPTEQVRGADRDGLIIRQVAIKAAVELANGSKEVVGMAEMLKVAEQIENWINR